MADMRDEVINTLNNELAEIKTGINAIKDSMNTHLKNITVTMNCYLMIIMAVLIVFAGSIIHLYQRPIPATAPDKTYDNYPCSENTKILTRMFRNLATGKDSKVHVATEGKAAIAYVDAGDEGYLFTEESVTCQLMSELTGDVTNCSVKHIVMTNQFQVSYQPTGRGRHQLHIKVEGEHIKGSPFTVTVTGKMDTPIKVDKNGICSDHSNDHMQVF